MSHKDKCRVAASLIYPFDSSSADSFSCAGAPLTVPPMISPAVGDVGAAEVPSMFRDVSMLILSYVLCCAPPFRGFLTFPLLWPQKKNFSFTSLTTCPLLVIMRDFCGGPRLSLSCQRGAGRSITEDGDCSCGCSFS